MKINPTDRYLSLVLQSLEDSIMPDLQSSSAIAAAGVAKTILIDLLKREHGSTGILRDLITRGEQLRVELAKALQLPEPGFEHVPERGFAALSLRHEQLTEQVADLCAQLSEHTGDSKAVLLRQAAEWEYDYYRQSGELATPELENAARPGSPLTAGSLEAFLNSHRSQEQGNLTVSRLQPLSGGFGKQTFLCDYLDRDGSANQLVIRKSDATPIMLHGACILKNEYALLRTLSSTGYPAPEPLDFADNWQDIDGTFYTMDKIPGQAPGGFLDGLQRELSQDIFLKLAELLARLHNTPLDTFSTYIRSYDDPRILEGTIEDCYGYALQGWRDYMRREQHLSSPYLHWILDWLGNNIPRDTRSPVLIHGDFNIHNILVDGDEVTAILDWECAEFASPEQDLAYVKPHISQHIDWQQFVNHYVASGGQAPDSAAMSFGLVYATLRMHLAGNRASSNLQLGINQDVRYAMAELGFVPTFMGLALQSAPA